MLNSSNPSQAADDPPAADRVTDPRQRFLSVAAVARAFGMSEATMYRAIRCGEFPAVRIRNRYVIPVKALDALEDAALTSGATVDPADWVDNPGQGVA